MIVVRTAAQRVGAAAEARVAAHLQALGWTILGRNVRVGRAEIDLLAIDPGRSGALVPASPMLVAVEVRWRSRRDFGLPEETVHRAKLARLRAAVLTLREPSTGSAVPIPRLSVRVDVVAVEAGDRMRHYRGVS